MADPTTLTKLRTALGYESAGTFAKDWKNLPEADKDQLRGAIEDGTLTY